MPIYCGEEKEKLEKENRELKEQLKFTKNFLLKTFFANHEDTEPQYNENFIELTGADVDPDDNEYEPILGFKRHKQELHSYHHEHIGLEDDELNLVKEIIIMFKFGKGKF